MATDKNLILNMPFDDPDGYGKAFDYSANRADGVLSGGAFLSRNAKQGKALDLNGSGECQTTQIIPFSSDFTICMWIKPTTKEIGWMLNYTGVNNYHDKWVNVIPNEWIYLSFVKRNTLFVLSIDGVEIERIIVPGNIIGFSINDSNVSACNASIDSFKMFSSAKTNGEILKLMANSHDVEYYIDGTNIKDMGVYVSKSTGIIGGLERKESLSVDYDNYHGTVVDKKRPRYKERTITLDCFLEASSKSSFIEWVMMFIGLFQKPGNQRLKIEYDGEERPLVYEIYCPNPTDVEKDWSYDDDLMVGTFKLKLVECEPVKRVLRHIGKTGNTQASITVSSSKLLNVYWGDGSHSYDISGANKTITHTYDTPGEYDIVIAGVIEDITAFATNCIVIWDKLQ